VGRAPSPDPLVRLLNHTEKFLGVQQRRVSEEADEGVRRGPGGPPHNPDLSNELMTQDTSEALPQTDKHVDRAPLACMIWSVQNHLHEWDHRKAITWP
jgi:hypothetical protein